MPLGAARITLLAFQSTVEAEPTLRTAHHIEIVNDNSELDTAISKFGGSSYKGSGTGALARYDGNTNDVFYRLDGPFTAELFFRIDSRNSQTTVALLKMGTSNATVPSAFALMYRNFDGKVQIVYYPVYPGSGTNQQIVGFSSFPVLADDVWHHLAFATDTNNAAAWVNGTRHLFESLDHTDGYIGSNGDLDIGSALNVGSAGYIDEVRISSVDRYGVTNTSITVPTAAFTNDSDTLALYHFDGPDQAKTFLDDNGATLRQEMFAFDNAKIDTAQSKFGSSSALFDGTGDKLETGDTSIMSDIGTGDFTFECFFRINSAPANAMIMNNMIGGGGGTGEWFVQYDPSNGLTLQLGGTAGFGYDNTITTGVWYHIAFIRTGTTCRFFIDGTQQGPDRTVSDALQTAVFRLGSGDGIQPFDGHIDEVRVSDTARYTTTFTPPSSAFTNDANTLLLLHMEGQDNSRAFVDDND